MADIDPDLLAAIAGLIGAESGSDAGGPGDAAEPEIPTMTDSQQDLLAKYERMVNQ